MSKAFKLQAGSIFANVALGAAAMGSVAAVTADWTAQQAALALQKQQGQVFAAINDAVGSYMTLLYPQLTEQSSAGVDDIPASCAKLPYRAGTSEPTAADILANKCKLTVTLTAGGNYTIKNAFQPTLADLKALGMLDHGISDTPVMPTELLVAGPNNTGAASAAPAANGYAISIQPKCVGMGSGASTCNKTNKALFSSVINIQPFAQSQYTQNFLPLLWAAGPDAAMSGPADASNVVEQAKRINPNGEFRSVQAGWTRDNPITRQWTYSSGSATATYTRGLDNLLLMRNGYDSAYWQMSRRDGSTPPTANWDFNGKDLTNVGKFTAASAEITGKLKVGGIDGDLNVSGNQTLDGNQTVKGNQTVNGNVSVDGTGTFKGLLSALGNLLVKGATELQGTLTVVGKAFFKDDVTLEKNLSVAGATTLSGALTGTSATFSGALTANSLTIGSTQITREGALLGGPTGWGVTSGGACSTNYALAQSADGKLQICRNGAWTALITSENIVITAPAVGQACSPEGAPGRLPDGTLALCKDGKWVSTAQGTTTPGNACSVEGALATGTAPPSPNLILLGCKGGTWTTNIFAKPRLGYATEGYKCQMDDELALDGQGGPSLLVCKNGIWSPPGTQLLAKKEGDACSLEGVVARDSANNGLLLCSSGAWSSVITSVNVSGGTGTTTWRPLPDSFYLTNNNQYRARVNRKVTFNGQDYYLYTEYDDRLNTSINQPGLLKILFGIAGNDQQITNSFRCTSNLEGPDKSWRDDDGNRYEVCLASLAELYGINALYKGRPYHWNFEFMDGAEIWTSTKRDGDGCDNWGCSFYSDYKKQWIWLDWKGGGGNGWDHVTVDLWNNHIFHRWNSDRWAVVLRVTRK